MASRFTALIAALAALSLWPVQAQQPTLAADASRAALDDISRGRFAAAIQVIEQLPNGEVSGSSDLLCLRGLARWGEALRQASILSSAGAELGMVLRANERLVSERVRRQADAKWAADIDAGLTAIQAEATRISKASQDLPHLLKEIDKLFADASTDFTKAATVAPRSKLTWCQVPEGWRLLATVHRLVFHKDRLPWNVGVTSYASNTPSDCLPPPDPKLLARLEREIDEQTAELLKTGDRTPIPAKLAHCIADACLLMAARDHKLDGRIIQYKMDRNFSSFQAKDDSPGRKPPTHFSDISQALLKDQVALARALYRIALKQDDPRDRVGAGYSAYAIELSFDSSKASDILKSLPRTGTLAVAQQLEYARFACMRNTAEGIGEIQRACGYARVARPVLSSMPESIRAASMRLSIPLVRYYGDGLAPGFEDGFRLITEAAKNAPTRELNARYQIARLRLARVLATSDLPWDRVLAYKQASKALVQLAALSDQVNDSERAELANAENALAKASAGEGFPPITLNVMPGQAVWIRDPFTDARTTIDQPLIVTLSGSALMILTGPRSD